MKSLLFFIMAVNFGFFLIAAENNAGDTSDLSVTNGKVPAIELVGHPLSAPEKPARSSKRDRRAAKPARIAATRPAKRIRTRSARDRKPVATAAIRKESTRPQQVASLGNTAINTNPKPQANAKRGKAQCYTIGPFIDKSDAFALNTQLEMLDVQSIMRTVHEKEQFWVYLQGRTISARHDRMAGILRRNGIKDFKFVTKRGKRYVLSVGWFDKHSVATKRYKKLASLGLTPKLEVKGSSGEQVWVNYMLPGGKQLPAAARKAVSEARKESFLQLRRCKR